MLRELKRLQGIIVPELVRGGDTESTLFILKEEARTRTHVLLIKDRGPDPSLFSSGKLVSLADLASLEGPKMKRVVIEPGHWSPVKADVGYGWTVAIPVAEQSAHQGIAGPPLVIAPLIRDLDITPMAPGGVFAMWEWMGPPSWMAVRLQWEFYDEEGYADIPAQEIIVSKSQFDRNGVFEFLNYRHNPGLAGWAILVTATPVLLGSDATGFPPLERTAQL